MTETRRGESEEMRIGLGWVLEHFTSLFVSFESSTTMPMAVDPLFCLPRTCRL